MSDENDEKFKKKLKKAANNIVAAGPIPFPITDTLLEIIKYYLDEEDINFIAKAFTTKKSLSLEQLVKKMKMPEEEIERIGAKLAKKGFIFNQPSSTGVKVFRLLPLEVVGAFEYTFMRKIPETEKEELKRIAKLYEKLVEELRDRVQESYDSLMPLFKAQPPTDRTVPLPKRADGGEIEIQINEEVKDLGEKVMPSWRVEEVIDKFDDIAVGNCFCRSYREVLGKTYDVDAPVEVCFTFGKSARHVVQQGFGRMISREEAKSIIKKAQEAGLVHKFFHNKSDIFKEENSLCNCHKDYCDTFDYWRRGAIPIVNSTNYLSSVDPEKCTGCGTCEERCPTGAIAVGDAGNAEVDDSHCIGCGVCAYSCPEGAISLLEGLRTVFIPPVRYA